MRKLVLLTIILVSSCSSINPINQENLNDNKTQSSKENIITSEVINTPSPNTTIEPLKDNIPSSNEIITTTDKVRFKIKIDIKFPTPFVSEFTILNYKLTKLVKELEQKAEMETIPEINSNDCLKLGIEKCINPTEFQIKYRENLVKTRLEETKLKAAKGILPIKIILKSNTEAELELPKGLWYITGRYNNAVWSIKWNDIEIDTTKPLTEFMLNTSNGYYSSF